MKNFIEGAVCHSRASGIWRVDRPAVAQAGEDGRWKRGQERGVFCGESFQHANEEAQINAVTDEGQVKM